MRSGAAGRAVLIYGIYDTLQLRFASTRGQRVLAGFRINGTFLLSRFAWLALALTGVGLLRHPIRLWFDD